MLNKMTTGKERQAFVFLLTEDLTSILGQPRTLYVTQTGDEFTFLLPLLHAGLQMCAITPS